MALSLLKLQKYLPDILSIGIPALGALAIWFYGLPLWMLVVCLVGLFFAVLSLLGDLGLFGGADEDD